MALQIKCNKDLTINGGQAVVPSGSVFNVDFTFEELKGRKNHFKLIYKLNWYGSEADASGDEVKPFTEKPDQFVSGDLINFEVLNTNAYNALSNGQRFISKIAAQVRNKIVDISRPIGGGTPNIQTNDLEIL